MFTDGDFENQALSDTHFTVVVNPFAERHFIKSFARKYKANWTMTLEAIRAQCARIESLVKNNRTSQPIHASVDNRHWVIKHPFAVAGMRQSPQGSGNRAILIVDRELRVVTIMLVYHKTDLGDGDETARWHALLRENCKEYLKHLPGF
jgi:hypothetical protein